MGGGGRGCTPPAKCVKQLSSYGACYLRTGTYFLCANTPRVCCASKLRTSCLLRDKRCLRVCSPQRLVCLFFLLFREPFDWHLDDEMSALPRSRSPDHVQSRQCASGSPHTNIPLSANPTLLLVLEYAFSSCFRVRFPLSIVCCTLYAAPDSPPRPRAHRLHRCVWKPAGGIDEAV